MRSWMVLATVALALLVAEGSWAGGTAQRWDYVALGDSLPFGAGDVAGKSFVPRYARLIAQDTGASVAVHNFATETGTASGVLYQLQHDPSRKAVKGAEIVTISIGVNDLEAHFGEYLSKSCGGPDNQQCFRDALPPFKKTWDAILAQVVRLRGTHKSIVRVTNDYNPFPGNVQAAANFGEDFVSVFTPYLRELNAYRCSTAKKMKIPCADVATAFNGPETTESAFAKGLIGKDEFAHPSAKGHQLIAQTLGALGYRPLH